MMLHLYLLWGISVLFIPETHSSNSTAEPTTQHVLHSETETQNATHKPAEMHVATTTGGTAVSPTVESREANVSSKSNSSDVSTVALVVVNTTAATGSSLGTRLLHTPTTAEETHPSQNSMMSPTAKPTVDQEVPTTSSETTAPATTFAGVSASSAASVATTAALSSLQTPNITEPQAASSNTSSENFTQPPHLIQNISSPTVPTATTETLNITSEAAPVFDPTSLPATVTSNATTSTELSSTSQLVSETQTHTLAPQVPHTTSSPSTTESPTTSASNDSTLSTTAFSSSAAGILIPRNPKRLPVSTTKSITSTPAAPRVVSKSPANAEIQSCSTRGVVKQCLIAIASLAVLATIFIITTIALCTKLSARKYKVKKRQQGTEMMCISALLPERNYSYSRQRNPISNGVRVIPIGGDSDEDGGDNLTLSSFLPENDRII
ncbi:hypothetical protein Q5P01_024697 [Channa striata]|uniref:P-selectin glycoprotein ligand 1 n=1 Tax=Channa striata TaxID=64152 RepID=A0AA88IS26_CHASR|nr:hypothetical protein Q5P01_024697 [Channa striata]